MPPLFYNISAFFYTDLDIYLFVKLLSTNGKAKA